MKKYIVDTKYGKYIVKAADDKTAAKIGYKKSIDDAMSVEQFRRVTDLLKCLRADIATEFETINSYEEHAAFAMDLGYDRIAKLLNDLRNEERAHVGELIAALSEVDHKDGENFNAGVEEATNIINGTNEPVSNQMTQDSEEQVQSINIEDIIKQLGAETVGTGTFNSEPVYFLSFASQDALNAAKQILNDNHIEIIQSTEGPVAKLFMLTIKQIGEIL